MKIYCGPLLYNKNKKAKIRSRVLIHQIAEVLEVARPQHSLFNHRFYLIFMININFTFYSFLPSAI